MAIIILGLGSNVGDRLQHLRHALQAIKKIPDLIVQQVSPLYLSDALLPEHAPSDWDKPYLNAALRCETKCHPSDLLHQLKQIESTIGRKPDVRHWGPRMIDIDILAWEDLILQSDVLTIPHPHVQERPFALWPLADVAPLWIHPLIHPHKTAAECVEAWGSQFAGQAPFHTRQLYQRLETPILVGTLNVTPDSFSDGGSFLEPEKALQHAIHLVNTGAEVIDLGAESTAPRAYAIDPETEWQRLQPVLSEIQAYKDCFIIPPKISIDTRHAFVAEKALTLGIDWINDVSGLDDPLMRDLIAKSSVHCVIMHHLHLPEKRDHVLPREADPVSLVYAWGEKRLDELEHQGIARERLIFDPGIGFGKKAEQSLLVLKNIATFKALNTRLLVGHSRKTFLSLFTDKPFAERDPETMAMALCLDQHVDYLRVHNVELCARGLRVKAGFEI